MNTRWSILKWLTKGCLLTDLPEENGTAIVYKRLFYTNTHRSIKVICISDILYPVDRVVCWVEGLFSVVIGASRFFLACAKIGFKWHDGGCDNIFMNGMHILLELMELHDVVLLTSEIWKTIYSLKRSWVKLFSNNTARKYKLSTINKFLKSAGYTTHQ